MADHLESDDIWALLFESENENEDSIFGDDTEEDPDFVLKENEP